MGRPYAHGGAVGCSLAADESGELRRGLVEPQAFDGLSADQVLLDDLLHVLHGDPAVPDALRIDHHRAAALAIVQAPGLVGADLARKPPRLQRRLEGLVERFAPLLRAGAAGMAGAAIVEADEQVLAEGRRHLQSCSRAARNAPAGSGADPIAWSRSASVRPRTAAAGSRASTRRRRGTAPKSASPGRDSATIAARAAAARSTSSGVSQATHAAMCVARAAPHRRSSCSPARSRA